MRNPELGKALLLTGPQYWDERRPLSGPLKRYYMHLDPLGIAIVSSVLRRYRLETRYLTMEPQRMNLLEKYIEDAGAVFISSRHFDTSLARQAIEMAHRHKKPVVVGGYGPTFNPQAFQEATTIVRGEAEPVIEQLVEHLLMGNLDPIYDATLLPPYNLENYIWPDRSIFPNHPGILNRFKRHSQEWQRGCSNFCAFCSPRRLQKGEIRTRKIPDIIAEIEQMKLRQGDFLFSVDLNTTTIPRETLYELFGYLKEKGIRWFTEGTLKPLLEDLEKVGEENSLLRLMSAKDGPGGCYSFLYGADDLAKERVDGSYNKERYLLTKAVKVFRDFGIPLNLSIVVGLDHHRFPETFFQTALTLEQLRAPYIFLHIATPYQGTPWGDQAYKGEKVFDSESTHFDHQHVVAHPKNMMAQQLEQGFYWLKRQLYNPREISQSARKNLDLSTMAANPTLGILLSGLNWATETYLSLIELSAKGHIKPQVQRQLDNEYQNWRKKEV